MIQNTEELKDHIHYGSSDLDYYIKRSKRIKTSELIVDSDRIEIRTPLNKSLEDTRNIVRNKAQWILRKQIFGVEKRDVIIVFQEEPHGNWYAEGIRL